MKPALLLMALAFLCGCKDARVDQQAAQIAVLKAELAGVKQKQAEQAQALSDTLAIVHEYNNTMTNGLALLNAMVPKVIAQNSYITSSIPEIIAASKPKQVPLATYQQQVKAAPKSGANHYGIPEAVFQTIYREAVKQWPDNFEMQEYRIKNQVEAYRKLHP